MEYKATEDKIFPKGKIIIREGEKACSAYLIKHGLVRVYRTIRDKEIEVARIGSGEIFGEMALISRRHHSFNVEAVIETEATPISPEIITRKVKDADPMIRAILLSTLERLAKMGEKKIREITGQAAEDPQEKAG